MHKNKLQASKIWQKLSKHIHIGNNFTITCQYWFRDSIYLLHIISATNITFLQVQRSRSKDTHWEQLQPYSLLCISLNLLSVHIQSFQFPPRTKQKPVCISVQTSKDSNVFKLVGTSIKLLPCEIHCQGWKGVLGEACP